MNIQTRPITLNDKNLIDSIREEYGHTTASHSFQSLYIWKDDMKLEIYLEDDMYAVKCNLKNNYEWFFPCGRSDRIEWFLKQTLGERISLRYMRKADVDLLLERCPDSFIISEYPGDDEYIYSCKEQIELKGSKLRTVRNHISRIQRDHDLRFEKITDENMSDVLKVSDAWGRKRRDSSLLLDITASELLMKNRKELDAMGVLVYMDEEPYAIVAGFPLCDNTFDMAMAKQVDTVSGLTSYAKYAMYRVLPAQYEFVNAEEDLDIAGLRTMKQQMGPIGKIHMYGAVSDGFTYSNT